MKAEALDAFRRSVDAGYHNSEWCAQDPDVKILHEDPEFKKLAGRRAHQTT